MTKKVFPLSLWARGRRSSKGQVLMSTVITGLIIAIIAAGLMRLVFMRFTASQKTRVQMWNTRCLQMAVGQFYSYWDTALTTTMSSGGSAVAPVCSSETGVFSCSGTSGVCNCSCKFNSGYLLIGTVPTAGLTVLVTQGPQGGAAPPCTFQVISNDMMNPPQGCQ